MISSLQQDKARSSQLQSQLSQLQNDFDFMRRNQQQWYAQLDARFQDIQRKIQASTEYVTSEAKRTNDILLAFQHKFTSTLAKAEGEVRAQLHLHHAANTKVMAEHTYAIKDTFATLDRDSKERGQLHATLIKDSKGYIERGAEALAAQKDIRILNEKSTMGKLDEELFLMGNTLGQEKDKRNSQIAKARSSLLRSISGIDREYREMHASNYDRFRGRVLALNEQMVGIFNSKDQIVNALSKVIKTLQQTMLHS